mgnify:CR=1 FL=1
MTNDRGAKDSAESHRAKYSRFGESLQAASALRSPHERGKDTATRKKWVPEKTM